MDCTLQLSDGRNLAYTRYGDPEGSPAFFFHGWPVARVHARPMHDAAMHLRLKLVALDRPGLGLSCDQPERTLLQWADDVVEVADRLGWSCFHVFGASAGGAYALAVAHQIPERLLSVQVIGGVPPLSKVPHDLLWWVYRILIYLRREAPGILGWVLRAGSEASRLDIRQSPARWALRLFGQKDRHALAELGQYEIYAQGMRLTFSQGVTRGIQDADLILNDWGFDLAEIQATVRFWHGQQDRNIHWTYALHMANSIPSSSTHWFEDEGHYSLPVNAAHEIIQAALSDERRRRASDLAVSAAASLPAGCQ